MKIEAFRNVRVGPLFGRVLIRLRRVPKISTESSPFILSRIADNAYPL